MMKIRARGANRLPGLKGTWGGPAFPRAGLTGPSSVRTVSRQSCGSEFKVERFSVQNRRMTLETFARFPDGPRHAGQFVSHSDSGLVVTHSVLQIPRPNAESIGLRNGLGANQNRAGTVNQQSTQVSIPLFADTAQSATSSAGYSRGVNPR